MKETKPLIYWNYFLALEEDFSLILKYIDILSVVDEAGNKHDNSLTFSTQTIKLLLNLGSETNIVLRELCKKYQVSDHLDNMKQYSEVLLSGIPHFTKVEVVIPKLNITSLKPWEIWDNPNGSKYPQWWISYNNIKTNRELFIQEANIKNCLSAIAALYTCVLFLYRDEVNSGELTHSSKLFNIKNNCLDCKL